MGPRATSTAYDDALRAGDPLGPSVTSEEPGDDPFVKFGISEQLVGAEQIESGLRAQTESTTDWAVDSEALRVCERDDHAWFSDKVAMGWTDAETAVRYEFDTRWSGTLTATSNGWRFVSMHVSTADRF